jgi:ribosomal protein S1
MRLKVIEVDSKRRRLVMSQMLAEREYRSVQREELFKHLAVGSVVEGVVRSIRPFGAFIDIGGVDGLLHVSEIGYGNVNHPREALAVGEAVRVQVIRIDSENQRVALSRRRLLTNPWDSIEQRYAAGTVVPATITRIADFGAFAELESGVEGLIHVSELADIAVAEPLKTVRAGDKVTVKVLRVDAKRQRIGLSIRQASDPGGAVG